MHGEYGMVWLQRRMSLDAKGRGFHLITSEILNQLPELIQVKSGLLHVFILHTSAALTINENADPDVQLDLETSMNAFVPEDLPFVHTLEGPDDMPAHVKASLLGASLSVPVNDGHLVLGTWQGIYLCEHRNRASSRQLFLTLMGQL